MTPPIFHLDDEVEITGPSRLGVIHPKRKFTISMLWKNGTDMYYSGVNEPWYPASSLRLVEEEPVFNVGDKVRITNGADDHYNCTFVIDIKLEDRNKYSCAKPFSDGRAVPYYSGKFLEKVPEELKIGDLVKVIGQPKGSIFDPVGKIATIQKTEFYADGGSGFCVDGYWYPAASLRKLAPEEIQQHQTAQMLPKPAEIQELRRRIHDLEMSLDGFTNGPEPEYVPGISHVKDPIRKRLSAIEKRQEEQQKKINQFDGEIGYMKGQISECLLESGDVEARTVCREKKIEKRLDFLEAYQKGEMPEVCEPAMTDIGAIAAIASFGPVPGCVAAFIRHETEEAEKRKLVGEPCHRNPKRNCALRNIVNRMDCAICEEVAQRVLDSMREA